VKRSFKTKDPAVARERHAAVAADRFRRHDDRDVSLRSVLIGDQGFDGHGRLLGDKTDKQIADPHLSGVIPSQCFCAPVCGKGAPSARRVFTTCRPGSSTSTHAPGSRVASRAKASKAA
jgi:hypothetical protein